MILSDWLRKPFGQPKPKRPEIEWTDPDPEIREVMEMIDTFAAEAAAAYLDQRWLSMYQARAAVNKLSDEIGAASATEGA